MHESIHNWADLRRFVAADRRGASLKVYLTRPTHRFVLALRLVEWIMCTPMPRWAKTLALMACRRYGRSFGFTIPVGTCGPGLKLPHWGSVVVSPLARIGAGATIHSGVNFGTWHEGAPVTGRDCYFSPGAKLFGPIVLGDRCRVGANAVVNASFPDESVLVSTIAQVHIQSSNATSDDSNQ